MLSFNYIENLQEAALYIKFNIYMCKLNKRNNKKQMQLNRAYRIINNKFLSYILTFWQR